MRRESAGAHHHQDPRRRSRSARVCRAAALKAQPSGLLLSTALCFGLAVFAAGLIHRPRRAFFSFAFGDTAFLVRILDVLVLAFALGPFFDATWHWVWPPQK